jgi:O-antigen/teichoic acid export membrane protein
LIKISKKEFKNGLLISFSNFYDPILLAVFTPIFIKNLSLEIYGFWVLIFSIANYAKLGSSGINSAVIKFLGSNKQKKKKEILLVNIIFIFLFYSLSLITILSVIASIFNFNNLISFDFEGNIEFFIVLCVVFIVLKSFEEILINIYISFEHYEISTFLKVFSKSVIFIMQVFIIIFYQDIVTLIKISSITLLLLVLIQFFIVQKKYNLINYSNIRDLVQIDIIKKIFYYTKGLIVNNLIGVVNISFDKFIVSYFLGLKILALYNIAFLIYSFIHSIFNSFFFYLFPKLSKMKNKLLIYKTFIRAEINIFILGLPLLFLIYLVSETFFKFWLGTSYDQKIYDYHELFLIMNFLTLPGIPIYYYLVTLKHTWMQAKIAFYNLILGIPLLLILGYYFSVYGIILSKIASPIIMIFVIIYIIKSNKK